MGGDDQQQSEMFSYVSLEDRVPQEHALRKIRELVHQILRGMAKARSTTERRAMPLNRNRRGSFDTISTEHPSSPHMTGQTEEYAFAYITTIPPMAGVIVECYNLLNRSKSVAPRKIYMPNTFFV